MATSVIKNPYAKKVLSMSNGTGVSNYGTFNVIGSVGTPQGYLQITSARSEGNTLLTITNGTLAVNGTLALVNTSSGSCYPVYTYTDGTIKAAGSIPTGFYLLVGAILVN